MRGINRRAIGNLDSDNDGHIPPCFLNTKVGENRDWDCKELWHVFCDCVDPHSRLVEGRLWHICFVKQLHTRLRAAATDGGNFSVVKNWEILDPEWHLKAQVQPFLVLREALNQKWFRTLTEGRTTTAHM